MEQVNVHEAKPHFSRLLDEAAAGEEIISSPVLLGSLTGKITISDSFDDVLPEDVINGFYDVSA